MTTPLVSIIIVNWNGRHLLARCLESVFNQTFTDFEVILVDNGSTDGSPNYIAATYPDVRLIPLTENRGFTGGNNEGFRQSNGSFIVLLNNDACLKEDWLERMVAVMESDAGLGSCASKIVIDGTDLLDSAGDLFTTAFTGTKWGECQKASDFTEPRAVAGPCAAAAIYRRSMLEQIGFLDDDFFLNHEDTDLNLRAWLAGWRCQFVPEAVAYHKVSASIGALSATSVYYLSRNSLWVWTKNVPTVLLFRFLPQRMLYELNSFVNFCLIHGAWSPFFRGKWDALKGLPIMFRKRKLLSNKRLSNKQIARELIPVTSYLYQRWRIMASLRSKQ
jgi:GT2 family glycosyltransferase